MQSISLKMLFRKKGTASVIIAIALLIALITAVDCLVNNISAQTTALTKLVASGKTYLITSQSSTGLSDSQIDTALINQIQNNSDIDYATAQQIVFTTLTTPTGNYNVTVLGIDNPQAFFNHQNAVIDGAISQGAEANIGIVLSNIASITKNDTVKLTIDNQPVYLTVAGITQAGQQSDTELIMPLATLQSLTKTSGINFVEFSIKDPNQASQALSNIAQALPSNIKISSTQQVGTFTQDINNQTIAFLNAWSIPVYVVVVAAAYVFTSRIVNDSEYELNMLRALGTKKINTVTLILTFALTVACISLILGLSMGIVGTQVAATCVRWVWGNTLLAPFLQPLQALGIFALALASCAIGSIYPAIKATKDVVEKQEL